MAKSTLSRPDFIGAFASSLCIVHCLLAPLFFVAQPVVYHQVVSHQGHHHGEGLWGCLDYVFLLVSLLAVWFAHKPQRSGWVRGGLWGGWACFALGLFLGERLVGGEGMMYLGSGILVLTHLSNLRWRNGHLPTAEPEKIPA
ncbi:MerC domain-containing protein [Neolewinella lacunae]|uniref:MerC domain-containing protein n=1 Tax=Neolewinella lacunae TaxID=1517758 RepID=A0A923T9J4_9BACT|nr:MerC domain-containing protein [Neolewinella lacunae]MBC6995128.1 MerC domain-containing protein [Neolewinella lacunae]MDN3634078.1 MerC domain-containing protein [Neolewinella lacunae]